MGLERIFGDFDARPLTYLTHFKWTFDVDISKIGINSEHFFRNILKTININHSFDNTIARDS